MSMNFSTATRKSRTDSASWFCAMVLLGIILLGSIKESTSNTSDGDEVRGNNLRDRACDEIYVVGEGETLNTISDKCGDPFIVERNPHIHDPDDVFPGLVIRIITPMVNNRKLLKR
uniref:LysM domain-containing protein n=1 Tax=Lotus japonicus TaxID=34305 RepID=I3SKH2_LOTJA|nr:unknown [Lotus japonicus]